MEGSGRNAGKGLVYTTACVSCSARMRKEGLMARKLYADQIH